jgi:hypothetical protein
MKIDAASMCNLIILLVCITLMFSHIVLSCKNAVRKAAISNERYTENKVKEYFLKLTSKDYKVFEKYGMWRYTVQY